MSTEVARRPAMGMGLISRDALKQSLGHIAAAMPKIATGGIDFLKMSKRGVWTFGQDETEVDDDDVWAVNPGSLEHGWIAWKEKMGQEPIGEHMGSAMRPLIDVSTLPKVTEGKGWQQQYGVEMVCVAGPNKGAHVLYKQTSVGATKLFNVYIDELMTRVENDAEEIIALVALSSETYDHKEWGETTNPVLEYLEWRTPEDASPVDDEPAAKAETPKVEAKPARQRAAPKPAAEAKPAEAASEDAGDEDAEPVQADGEDEDDFMIRMAQWRKKQKAEAAAVPAEAAQQEEATPRRRERRTA